MKPLFSDYDYDNAGYKDKLLCECYECKTSFLLEKQYIQKAINPNNVTQAKYCSRKCLHKSQTLAKDVICTNCKKSFLKRLSELKSTNNFCTRSCAAIYNNTHKTHGIKRSKLEKYLEEQLNILYPNLSIDFNKKNAINSELDIYIPSLKLAFELNGIYHYEPIHGQDKLDQIQNNDHRKFQACIEAGISLCIIDSSGLSYFKTDSANKFLSIITEIINKSKN